MVHPSAKSCTTVLLVPLTAWNLGRVVPQPDEVRREESTTLSQAPSKQQVCVRTVTKYKVGGAMAKWLYGLFTWIECLTKQRDIFQLLPPP